MSGHTDDHGNTVAAWVAVTIMIIGAVIAALAFAVPGTALFWVGSAVFVLGAVVGKVLQVMGYGKKATA